MAANGDAGSSMTTVLGYKNIIVGDHPNINPANYVEPTGQEIDEYSMSGAGMIPIKSAIPTFRSIDTGGDFHGGDFTVDAMNAIHFTAGAGGFTVGVNGDISLMGWGGKVSIISTTQAGITAKVVRINSTNTIKIGGPTLYVDAKETIFNKNVTFGNNVKINGGLAVNGELFAPHITGQRQVRATAYSGSLKGYIPEGAILMCEIEPDITKGAGLTTDGGIAPGPIMLTVGIPSAFSFISIPPHNHFYDGLAFSEVGGLSDLYDEMQAVDGDKPVEAKANSLEALNPSHLLKQYGKIIEKFVMEEIGKIPGL